MHDPFSAGLDVRVQPQQVGLRVAREVEVEAAGLEARQQDRVEIAAARRVDVLEHTACMTLRRHAVERVLEARDLGRRVVVLELGVVRRIGAVPVVLVAERNHDLVDQRVTEPGDLRPRPVPVLGAVLLENRLLLAARARVDPDVLVRSLGEVRDRNLDLDRVRVVVRRASPRRPRRPQRDQVERVERTQPGQIEDRAEVDVERIVALPGEDLDRRPAGW